MSFLSAMAALETKKTDTTKFIDLVRKYSQITELTPQIINEFIDKVTVHQAVKIDGKRRQDIEVDIVNIPLHIFLKKFEMFCIGINPHGA